MFLLHAYAYAYVDSYVAHVAASFCLTICLDAYACIQWKPGFSKQWWHDNFYQKQRYKGLYEDLMYRLNRNIRSDF